MEKGEETFFSGLAIFSPNESMTKEERHPGRACRIIDETHAVLCV